MKELLIDPMIFINRSAKSPAITLATILILFCASVFAQQKGNFTDPRDGKTYKTAKIGEQTWMAENLNYDAEGSICYRNNPIYCSKYGRLYNWETAKKICPEGWHLPNNAEWDKLFRFADGNTGTESPYQSETAGNHLKAARGWDSYGKSDGNGTDKYGFSALPGGYGEGSSFYHVGSFGYWWSASEYEVYSDRAYRRYMNYKYGYIYWSYNDYKSNLLSVRCVQN